MKKIMASLISITLILSVLAVPALARPGRGRPDVSEPDVEDMATLGPGDNFEADLVAGQHIDVGNLLVEYDGENLHVTYMTKDNWYLIETHLQVSTDYEGIPTNRGGNPIPGHFEFSDYFEREDENQVAKYLYVIPDSPENLYIAAHAVVENVKVIQEAPYGGSEVVDTKQAWRYDGTPVIAERSNPDAVLNRDFGEDASNFYSLGYGGTLNDENDAVESFFGEYFEDRRDPENIREMEDRIDEEMKEKLTNTENNAGWIIVKFDPPVLNVEGENDLLIVEDTWGLPYPLELAAVFARTESEDDWTFLFLAHNQLPDPDTVHTVTRGKLGDLDEAVEILVQDVTDPEWFSELFPGQRETLDGYDLNAIEALNDYVEIQEETAWAAQTEREDGEITSISHGFPGGNWATFLKIELIEEE